MILAVVKSLDRVNGVANVIPYGQTVAIPARYLSHRGRPNCWPLGNCYIEQLASGQWQVVGGVGDRRVLLHDDFLTVPAGEYGDTPWTLKGGGGVTVTQSGVGAGSARITNTSSVLRSFYKDSAAVTAPASPNAIWFSCSASIVNITSDGVSDAYQLGLVDPTGLGFDFVLASFRPGVVANWFLDVGNGSSGVLTPLASPPVVSGQVYAIDIIWVSGIFATLSVDGSDLGLRTDLVPTAAIQPAFQTQAANRSMDIDWVHVERVTPVLDPRNVPGLLVGKPSA